MSLAERYQQDMSIRGIGSKGIRRLDKQYGEGNWNLTGGPGYAASGTVKQYGKQYDGYRHATVYHKLPTIQETKPEEVEEPDLKDLAQESWVTGPRAELPVDEHNPETGEVSPPDGAQSSTTTEGTDFLASLISDQVKSMQSMFKESMQQQMMQFQQMQEAQNQRMEALQAQMMQSMRDQAAMQQTRPEVAGVKMAEGTAGTVLQIARRGVSGAFGRRGLRISSLNV
jgi:hypothetical protein|tara:strand:+ start:200 stop:880 length:681 start_codon:yes stop_codon:yes gene_type:complete